MTSLRDKIPAKTLQLLDILKDALKKINCEHCYIAGGWVRDTYSKRKSPHDIDLVISQFFTENFIKQLKEKLSILDISRIPISTLNCNIHRIKLNDFELDIRDLPEPENYDRNILDRDLKTRDFTVNSLYYDIINDKVIDLCDGMRHIDKQLLVCTVSIDHTFVRNYSRFLRLVRFMAEQEMEPHQEIINFLNDLSNFKASDYFKFKECKSDFKKIIESDFMPQIFEKLFDYNIHLIIENLNCEDEHDRLIDILISVQKAVKAAPILQAEKLIIVAYCFKQVFNLKLSVCDRWLQIIYRDIVLNEKIVDMKKVLEGILQTTKDTKRILEALQEKIQIVPFTERQVYANSIIAHLIFKLPSCIDHVDFRSGIEQFYSNIRVVPIFRSPQEVIRELERVLIKGKFSDFKLFLKKMKTIDPHMFWIDTLAVEKAIVKILLVFKKSSTVFFDFNTLMKEYLKFLRYRSLDNQDFTFLWTKFIMIIIDLITEKTEETEEDPMIV